MVLRLRNHREFAASQDVADGDAWAIGSGELAHALHDFGSNWKIHRDKLLDAMDSLAKAATDSAAYFRDTDTQLGHTFDKDHR